MKRLTRDCFHYAFDPSLPPALQVEPGESFWVETNDAHRGTITSEAVVYASLEDVLERLGGANPVAGPITVRGARAGDCLAVTIEEIVPAPRRGFGYTCTTARVDPALRPETVICPIEAGAVTLRHARGEVAVPLRPMIGTLGVAPAGEPRPSFGQGADILGNVDIPELGPGATVVLRAPCDGGLLFLGDAHLAQGDAEIHRAAIETEADVRLSVSVLPSEHAEDVGLPQLNTTAFIGSVAPGPGHLEDLIRAAYDDLARRLVVAHGFELADAYRLLGTVGRVTVGQVVPPVFSALATLERRFLPSALEPVAGERELLLIPGPVTVSREVREALARPVRAHYGEDWVVAYRRVAAKLAELFRTASDVLLVFGPGTAALEMAVASVLSPGDAILIPPTGAFADRLAAASRAVGLEVVSEGCPGPVQPLEPDAVIAALDRRPEIRAVAVVQHETIYGLVNPVREVTLAARERGLLSVVDAVSSLGGVELDVDAWGIDLCVTVGNKCLAGPVGVAPLAVGPRAWAALDDGRPKCAGWYLNLATWRDYAKRWGSWHPHPTTMPTSAIEALEAAVDRILADGLEAFQARQAGAAGRVRQGLRALGFEMLVPDEVASPVVTAARGRGGMDVEHYVEWLRRERRLRVASGTGDPAGRIFRVGHMGEAAADVAVDAFLAATGAYLDLFPFDRKGEQ